MQSLLKKFEHEKKNLQMAFQSIKNLSTPAAGCSNTTCCTLSAEMLCTKSGFDSWMVILPMFNQKSLALDVNLLQELSKSVLVDRDETYQVGTLVDT